VALDTAVRKTAFEQSSRDPGTLVANTAVAEEAKITEATAAEAVLKAVPGGVIQSVELEKEDGKFIYSYDVKTSGKSGIDEVHVDAMTGAVVGNVHETPADEKKEAAKAAPARPKKP